jgi:chromosome segregation ATPase
LDTLVDNLFKMLDDRFTKMDDRFAELTSSMDKGEKRQVESMSHLEDRLLAKIEAFNGQIGDLRTNAIDHERRINDQDQRINKLKSNLLKLESVHKGYKDTNNELIATLRTDVNNTRAKIPELRREVQDSAVSSAENTRTPLPVSRSPSKRLRPLSLTYTNSNRNPGARRRFSPKTKTPWLNFLVICA